MVSYLKEYKLHDSAMAIDRSENAFVPSEARVQNQPSVRIPGYAEFDSMVTPTTASARNNPYNTPVLNDQDRSQWFQGNIFTAGQQVQLFLNGAFGSSGAYMTPPMYEPSSNDSSASTWNSFSQTPSYRMHNADNGLSGRPTATKLRNLYETDAIDPDFKLQIGFSDNRPTSADFEQSMHIALTPGQPGSFTPNEACECRIDPTKGVACVQAIAVSSANFVRLYEMMLNAGILKPIESLVIYNGRLQPCLCSYITTTFAKAFVGFTRDMIYPAIYEPDMSVTLYTINETFVDRLLGNLYGSQERVKRTQYYRFMGRAAQYTLPPKDGALETGMSKAEWSENIGSLEGTRYLDIDGTALFTNVNTAAAAHQLSRPRTKQWTEDAYLLTGYDSRPQVDIAYSGAITSGLDPQIDFSKLAAILEKYSK